MPSRQNPLAYTQVGHSTLARVVADLCPKFTSPIARAATQIVLVALSVQLLLSGCALSPVPLDEDAHQLISEDRASRLAVGQEPVLAPIGLHEAMARALKYNLDHQVEKYQGMLRLRQLDLSHHSMLPQVVADAGIARRDEYPASRSIGIDALTKDPTGQNVLSYNTSQEKAVKTADLTFSWHVLDFGLSYIRARQAADEVLVAEEARRKVSNRIIEDVRTAYFRAASAERLTQRLGKLEARVRASLSNMKAVAAEGQAPPLTTLTVRRELLGILRTIEEMRRDLLAAKPQLAVLMNLPPSASFALDTGTISADVPSLPQRPVELMRTALAHRPELRDITYRQRINEAEVTAALLESMPGIQLYGGPNFDSNTYLLSGDWLSWGAKASWNLIRLVQYPARREVIHGQTDLLDQRALAMSMAVMLQVHVATSRLDQAKRQLAVVREYLSVQKQIVNTLRVDHDAGRVSEQALIREEMNAIVAEAWRDLATAEIHNSFANVNASIGTDLVDAELASTADLSRLTDAIREGWAKRIWTRGVHTISVAH